MRTLLFFMLLLPALAGAVVQDVTMTKVAECYYFSDGKSLCFHEYVISGGEEVAATSNDVDWEAVIIDKYLGE